MRLAQMRRGARRCHGSSGDAKHRSSLPLRASAAQKSPKPFCSMQRGQAQQQPEQPIVARSAVFDHGQLGLTVRRKGSFKDSAAQNFTAIAAALVDLAAGKDWTETAKAVRCLFF